MLFSPWTERGYGIKYFNTINNVFNIVFIALGDSVAIVVGQLLGAGKMKKPEI